MKNITFDKYFLFEKIWIFFCNNYDDGRLFGNYVFDLEIFDFHLHYSTNYGWRAW
jgi:hypothetical protein